MSFLAADTPDATLAAALAFIDSFDGSSAAAPALGPRFSGSDRGDGRPAAASEVEDQAAASSGSSASSPPQLASAGGGDSAEEERSAAGSGSDGSSEGLWGLRAAEGDEKRRPKKTKKSTAQASKRLREKKKREMAALMEEAAGLETRLAALQRRATIAVDSPALGDDDSDAYIVATTAGAARTRLLAICPADGEASWMDVAVREARHLERSEALNTELRRALEDQSKLADALRGFVSGHPAAMSAVSALDQFRRLHPSRGLDSPFEDLITDLQLQISGLYVDTDTVFKPEGADSVSASMRTRRDDSGNLVLEIETTTPVMFPMEDAVEFLGAGFDAKDAQDHKLIIDKRSSELELDKRFVVEIASAGAKEKFNGALFLRRFLEPTRLVIVYGETLTPPSATMQIREKAWMLVTASSSPSLSLVRSFYQATVATLDRSAQGRLVAELALREWGRQVFISRQLIQNVILEQASRRAAP